MNLKNLSDKDQKDFRCLFRAMELLVELVKTKIEMDSIMKEFDDLVAEVAQDDTVIESAITLINGIAERIAAAGVDPVKLKAVTDDLAAKRQALAGAVQANTVAAP